MALLAPKLDDRHFQDIVDEAKKRIPHYCKEWTDHNVSDPGVTLIELFAWMTDILLYRLNRVPDLHYIKFMEFLGVRLRESEAARAPITFWFSAPQNTPVLIPAGTEVASTQTETERSIIFTTDTDLTITPPQLSSVRSWITNSAGQKKAFHELSIRSLEVGVIGEALGIFSQYPQKDDALYFGFENDLSFHLLGFKLEFDLTEGVGIDPTHPPFIWEASTGDEAEPWKICDVDEDTTLGMNRPGSIRIHLPGMGLLDVDGKKLFWVRVRVTSDLGASPRLRRLTVASWGGTTIATHARLIQKEFLGRSDGSAGQRFNLQNTPILRRQGAETLVVHEDGKPSAMWHEVPDFAESGMGDPCFVLDSQSGEVRLGPAIRQPDGTIKLFGAIPPRGANLYFERYRIGGGKEGNVQAFVINTCKTSIPYVARVANRIPAAGGLDAETLENAMVRIPALLRSRERAVTESDYEFLTRQALPAEVGRVKCVQPRPSDSTHVGAGMVFVLVIPRIDNPQGYLFPKQLELKPESVVTLRNFLNERSLLTTYLDIRSPEYAWVSVKVSLRAAPNVDQSKVENAILERLYCFINPLTGGTEGTGWPFGRDLYTSDIYQCLQGIPDVLFIRSLEMYRSMPEGDAYGEPVESLNVLAHSTIASGKHQVIFV